MQTQTPSNWFVFDDLSERCLGNLELMGRVLKAFGESVDSDLDTIASAIRESDVETLAITAHRIKGGAANAAAHPMSRCAAELEKAARQNDNARFEQLFKELQTSFAGFLEVKEQELPQPPQTSTP